MTRPETTNLTSTEREQDVVGHAGEKLEKGFYHMLMQAPAAIVVFSGPDYLIEFANDLYLPIAGRSREELLNKPAFETMPVAEAQGFRRLLDEIRASGEPYTLTDHKTLIDRNGRIETAWLNIVYQPLRGLDDRVHKVMIMITEVTEQVLRRMQSLEEESILRKTKNQLELSISIGNIGIWHWDVKNDVLTWSKEQLSLYGLTSEEFGGKILDFHQLVLPEDLQLLKRTGEFEQQSDGDFEYQFRMRRKDGEIRWIQGRSRSFYGDNGELLYRTGVNIDITDRKRNEEALRQSEELFRTAFAHAAIGMALGDASGRFITANQAYLDMFGYTFDEIRGMDSDAITHPDDVAMNRTVIQRLLEGYEHGTVMEKRYLRKDGKTVWGQVSLSVVRNEEGKPLTLIGLVKDITEEKKARQQLIESEERFRSTFDNAAVGISHVAPNGDWLMVNHRLCQILGYTEGDLLASNFQHVTHPDDLEKDVNLLQQILDGKRDSYAMEKRYIHSSGKTIWANLTVSVVKAADGRAKYFISVVEDISERKKAEEKIVESEERLALAISAASLGLWDYDIATDVTTISDRSRAFYNLKKDEPFTFEKFISVVHPEDQRWVSALNRRIIFDNTSPLSYSAEFRVIRRDGAVRWMYSSGKALVNEKGERYRFTGAIMDVTEKKLTAEALQQSEKRIRTLADALPQMVWMTDEKGNMEYASRKWFTYSGHADVSAAWKAMVHPDDLEAVNSAWKRDFAEGRTYRHEVRLKNWQGEYRWHYSIAEPVRDERGNIIKWIGAMTDIHVQKTFSEHLEDEVKQRTQELQRSNEDLQQFAHVASHDLKEPIRKVSTFASRLEEEYGSLLPERGKLYLAKVLSSIERMFGLIDGVLNYSVINSLENNAGSVNLSKVLQNIAGDLEVLVLERNAALQLGTLPVVNGSEVLLNQLFYNLLNNSLKFTREGVAPVISVTAREVSGRKLAELIAPGEDRDFVEVQVCDNGIGFKPEHAAKIFKTFTRLNSRDKFEGTGLGLALCKKIVERHHGYIYATGKEGEGACFHVLLPA